MNIRPSFGRRGCRIVVTGKRGHRVYASRDDVVEETEDVPVSCRGGRCTRAPSAGATSGAPAVMYTPVTERDRGGARGRFDFAIARASGESSARHCFHRSTYRQVSRRVQK